MGHLPMIEILKKNENDDRFKKLVGINLGQRATAIEQYKRALTLNDLLEQEKDLALSAVDDLSIATDFRVSDLTEKPWLETPLCSGHNILTGKRAGKICVFNIATVQAPTTGELQKQYKVPASIRVKTVAELSNEPMQTIHSTSQFGLLARDNGDPIPEVTSTSGSQLGKCIKCPRIEQFRDQMALGSSMTVQTTSYTYASTAIRLNWLTREAREDPLHNGLTAANTLKATLYQEQCKINKNGEIYTNKKKKQENKKNTLFLSLKERGVEVEKDEKDEKDENDESHESDDNDNNNNNNNNNNEAENEETGTPTLPTTTDVSDANDANDANDVNDVNDANVDVNDANVDVNDIKVDTNDTPNEEENKDEQKEDEQKEEKEDEDEDEDEDENDDENESSFPLKSKISIVDENEIIQDDQNEDDQNEDDQNEDDQNEDQVEGEDQDDDTNIEDETNNEKDTNDNDLSDSFNFKKGKNGNKKKNGKRKKKKAPKNVFAMNPCTMPGGNANRPQPGVVISTTFLDDVCGINPTPDFRSYEEKQKDPTNGGKQNVKHLRKGPSVVMSLPDCIFRADNMLGLDTDIPDSLMKSLFFDDSLMFINQKASEEQSSPSSPSIITDQIRDCNNRDFKFLNSF